MIKISHKLVGSFIGVSLLTGVVGAVAIAQYRSMAETLAIAEAEHVAQVISPSILHRHSDQSLTSLKYTEDLKSYITRLHQLQQRDVSVVNREKLILADAVPEEIGTNFAHDQGNEVQETLKDGKPRSFLEKSADYPQGIKLLVVPLKSDQDKIVGAVVLEWSSLYDEAIAQGRPTMLVIGFTSLSCVILAWLIGLRISRSIANPLQAVTAVAQQVTETSNFDLQAPVTTKDETGILATALNHLIRQVNVLLNEKEKRSQDLQQALTQLHKTQFQLVQTEKMSSLGQLVAGVAHEINNPVNFIHGNLIHIDSYTQDLLTIIQAYQTHYPNPPQTLQATLDEVELDFLHEDLIKLLQSMKVGTDRIRQIVLSLRNFSRLDEAEFKAVDLHEGIDNTLLILQYRLKSRSGLPPIEVIKNYSQLPLVECYPGQLNQVFMNLLANAIDSLHETISSQTTDNCPPQPGTIWISTQLTADNQAQIIIADNGAGMPEVVRSRLFDPFFTTKPVGKGTGLGLSISYQIVTEKHRGKLWCNSAPNQGAKFVIEIPVQQTALSR
ncbi:MAG: ATP-binding protein [Leptolyngbya sp. BL-A-14]